MNDEKYYKSKINSMRIGYILVIVGLVLMLMSAIFKQQDLREDLSVAKHDNVELQAYNTYLETKLMEMEEN